MLGFRRLMQVDQAQGLALALFVIAVAKMALVWGNETVSEGSDSILYLLYARDLFWGAHDFPLRGPGFPLWIALCHAVHVPLRIATEGLLLATAGAFVAALFVFRYPPWLLIAAYAGIVFYPATFNIFDQPMSEGFFACIGFLSLACFFVTLSGPSFSCRIVSAAALGISFAVLLNTRGNDAVPIYVFIAYALAALMALSLQSRSLRTELALGGSIVAGLLLVHLSVLTTNYLKYGYFAENEIVSSGGKKLLHAMMSIDTGEPAAHEFIAVTNSAREVAYELSPTFRQFKHEIEDDFRPTDLASPWGSVSRTGVKDQIDIQSTLNFIREIVLPHENPSGRTPVDLLQAQDALQEQIAREIEIGLDEGKAKRRPIFYIWDPLSGRLYQRAGEAALRLIEGLFHVETAPAIDNYPFPGSPVSPLYDEMASRRLYLIKKGPLEGIVAVRAPRTISAVAFEDDAIGFFARNGIPDYLKDFKTLLNLPLALHLGAAALTPLARGDLPANWASNDRDGWNYYKFAFPAFHDRFFLDFGKFALTLDNGAKGDILTPTLGRMLRADIGGDEATGLVTSYETLLKPYQRWGYAIQIAILSAFNRVGLVVVLTGLALALATRAIGTALGARGARGPRRSRLTLPRLIAVGAVLLLVSERIVFYAFIDATIVALNDDRHLFAANILGLPLVLILIFEIGTLGWLPTILRRPATGMVEERRSPSGPSSFPPPAESHSPLQ